ncbi:hypothetical protein C0Q70_16784 [Pomacea canaliculata]|uniref:Neurotransmitter-gated ion-channel ligand-binding domain-containing protein n=1 Tax=Pomacea canaliculata TaxID=400727 RepID=A0A2T7NQT5_POMCA|nr:hypothetical protein C0Q70_16784 [Pomacea canaliculata]
MDVTGSIRKKERSVGLTSATQLRPGKQRRMALVAFVVLAATVVAGSEASIRCKSNSSSRQPHRMFGNEAVIRHILEDYQKLGRPARGMEEVEVSLKAGLMSIDGLVEQDELFSFTAWLTFVWRDPRLTWGSGGEDGSAESHGPSSSSCQDDLNLEDVNVTSLILPQSAIWTPTILVSNSVTGFQDLASSDFEAGQVVIERDGLVTWIIGDRFDVRCSVNTHKFPFDEQVCFAEFTTDTVLYGHINLQLDTTTVNCSAYRPNAEVSFSVALLLSYVIFMSSISSTLPPNSLTVCLYSLYLAASPCCPPSPQPPTWPSSPATSTAVQVARVAWLTSVPVALAAPWRLRRPATSSGEKPPETNTVAMTSASVRRKSRDRSPACHVLSFLPQRVRARLRQCACQLSAGSTTARRSAPSSEGESEHFGFRRLAGRHGVHPFSLPGAAGHVTYAAMAAAGQAGG